MKNKFVSIVFLCVALSTACQTTSSTTKGETAIAPVQATATQAATDTPVPTNTIRPTDTATLIPTNTATKAPTASPTIAPPEIISSFVKNPEITSFNNFDMNIWNFDDHNKDIRFTDGMITFTGKNFWNTWIGFMKTIPENSGVLLRYRYSKLSEFEFYLDKGRWKKSDYRRFGVYGGNIPRTNVWFGSKGPSGKILKGILNSKIDTWQMVMLAVDDKGTFIALIWSPENQSQFKIDKEELGDKWTGINWNFSMGANSGTINIDEFYQFKFSGIN